jgi:aminoglycoside phosphotransferase
VILARDPAVPHRDDLLDGRRVAELLSGRLLDEPVVSCALRFAKYRVGDGLRVVYRVAADGVERHVAARGFAPGASADAYRRAVAAAVPAPPLRPVVHVPELDAVFWTFPNDRRLTTLPLLAGRSGTLDRLVGHAVTPELVAYSAERSASARCAGEDGRIVAYAKVHTGDAADRERRRLEAARAANGDRLRVPHVIGASALDGALVVEAVDGRSLEALDAGELPEALRRMGAALATLHERTPVPGHRFERLDIERLAKAVSVIARARPDAGPVAAELLARLLVDRDDGAGPDVALHGDANLRNAIFDDDRVTLIDFEDASAGPAAADLGQVLARLRAARLTGEPAAADEHVLEGYAEVRPLPTPAALRWHTGASILARVALPAVSRVRPPLLRVLPELLESATNPGAAAA